MKDFKRWVYHATKEPKIILDSEFEACEAQGWADSPAKFIKTTDFGVDPDNSIMVQQLGEAIEGVKDAANGAINLDKMNKKQLEEYALKHFEVDLDRRKTLKQLRLEVSEMVGI